MAIFLLIFLLLLIAYSVLIDYYRRWWNGIKFVHNRQCARCENIGGRGRKK